MIVLIKDGTKEKTVRKLIFLLIDIVALFMGISVMSEFSEGIHIEEPFVRKK